MGSPTNNAFVNQSQTMGNQASGDGSHAVGSPAQSLNNIQKISARLRARNNPVVMSMNNSPQMLLPLSQRSLSPASYQQLQTQGGQEQPRGNLIHGQMPSQQIQVSNFWLDFSLISGDFLLCISERRASSRTRSNLSSHIHHRPTSPTRETFPTNARSYTSL